MKKPISVFLAVIMTFAIAVSFAACGAEEAEPAGLKDIPSVENTAEPTAPPVSDTDIADPEPTEPPASESPSPSPEVVDDTEVLDTYRSFLSENYQALSDACYGGISGIGFIDLDCDGSREMIIFDAGASASMGVQFFDIYDGKVECVSANMQSLGDTFGGSHFTKTYVNANFFEDFRLVEDLKTGERFFLVESGNGSIEFSYRELIRFGRDGDDMLTLTPLFYVQEEYDLETGDVTSAFYRINNEDASEKDYSDANSAFLGNIIDLGLEAQGVFAWASNDPAKNEGKDGLLSMAEEAVALSENNVIDR